MKGGILLVALLCAALGLALSFAPRRTALPAAALLIVVALATFAVGIDQTWRGPVVAACSISIVATALCVHVPRGPGSRLAMSLAANAGIWCGAAASAAGPAGALFALPLVLIAYPGHRVVSRGLAIGLKVLSGWLVAIAILATALPLITTPGYASDHME